MKCEIEVTDCRDCPFRRSHRGHGENWTFCDHKDSPEAYGSILWGGWEEFKELPEWCPINDK